MRGFESSRTIASSARTVFPDAVGAATTTFSPEVRRRGNTHDCILLKNGKGKRVTNCPLIESATESIRRAYLGTTEVSPGRYFKLCIGGKSNIASPAFGKGGKSV